MDLRIEPNLASIAVHRMPQLVPGECGDWRGALQATFSNRRDRADVAFPGHYAIGCGEHDWYVALLDHSHYAGDIFVRAWASAGGRFEGGVRDGHAPLGATPIATLLSPPLYDIVRDINKLSNNVMARQLFLTLATSAHPPPATTAYATEAVKRWLAKRKLVMPELALDNGSGLSRRERIAARSMARLLVAAQASSVGAELVSSRWHRSQPLQRWRGGRSGVPQDRHARGRACDRRLRIWPERTALRRGLLGQPS